ncbi:MAG: hypothetical protein V2A66_00445 [Pseudomonadota bacterium]
MAKLGFKVSGVIFLIIALMHLLRILFKVTIVAGGHNIPLWMSWGGVAISGIMAIWTLIASYSCSSQQGS